MKLRWSDWTETPSESELCRAIAEVHPETKQDENEENNEKLLQNNWNDRPKGEQNSHISYLGQTGLVRIGLLR